MDSEDLDPDSSEDWDSDDWDSDELLEELDSLESSGSGISPGAGIGIEELPSCLSKSV